MNSVPRPLLPFVTREVAVAEIADLIRRQIEAADGDSVLADDITLVLAENPEIVASVQTVTQGLCTIERRAALAAMAVTYRLLKAAAEVESIAAMAGAS